MIDIYKILEENDTISAWSVRREATESFELFFVHEKLETVRATDTENVNISVYHDHGGKRGNASFKIFASTTEEEAKQKLDEAAEKAAIISNEFYTLPEKEVFDGKIDSDFEAMGQKEIAERIASAVFSADMLDHGSINSLEIFVNKHTISVKNNRGLDKREIKYSAMVEAIPTWNDGESVELYEAQHFSTLDAEKVKREIEKKMCEVRDRGRAVPPESHIDAPVLIPLQELSSLCRELISGLDYASVYSHSNPFSLGDAIQKAPRADKLNITARAVLEGSAASALFDADGTTLIDTELVRDGVAVGYFGARRFAEYLNKVPTGNLPCAELGKGTLTDDELKTMSYFECVSMSGLQIDIFNDYIGGEVRLAYYFDGKEKHPITGISISGKLSDALNSLRLSEKVGSAGRYHGPEFALLDGVKII